MYLAKLRWRVERDYQEMKEDLGLDHFEGRTWRGFHHHVTLCAAAHAFVTLLRVLSAGAETRQLASLEPALATMLGRAFCSPSTAILPHPEAK